MIAAHIARPTIEPAPRRDFIGRLLLTGMPYTDARPWIGFVGMAVTGLVGAIVLKVLS